MKLVQLQLACNRNSNDGPHQLLRDWSPVLNSCLPQTWLAEFTNHVTW